MRIAVYGSVQIAEQFRGAKLASYTIEEYHQPTVLVQALRRWPIDLLVIDPRDVYEQAALWAPITQFDSTPLMLYSNVDEDAIAATVGCMSKPRPYAVMRNAHDCMPEVHRFLQARPLWQINRKIVQVIGPRITRLPRNIGTAIRFHFSRAEPDQSVDWLAAAAGTSRRSIERGCATVGLTSAHLLAVAPSAVRAYCYLTGTGQSAGAIARMCGLSSRRTLLAQFGALLEMHSFSEVSQLDRSSFTSAISRALQRDPGSTTGDGLHRA